MGNYLYPNYLLRGDILNFEVAFEIATIAHLCQQDKGGNPYIQHPIAVSRMMDTEKEKIVAILHDVLEKDKDLTLEYLRSRDFEDDIILAIDAITKRENESDNDFMRRIKSNKLATKVKIKDLWHDMDLSRIPKPTKEDLKKIQKHRDAEFYLQN